MRKADIADVGIQQMRKKLISELIDNPVKYNVDHSEIERREIKSMLQPDIASYAVVFWVAAEMYNVEFVVYFGLEQPLVFRPVSKFKHRENLHRLFYNV